MRNTMITGALAVVATTGLIGWGGAAGASTTTTEPTTTNERGILVECSGTYRGKDVYASVYETNVARNVVQVVIGDKGLGASRATKKPFMVAPGIHATLKLDGARAIIDGRARVVGKETSVYEEHDDAGQHITVEGTHRRIRSDLNLTWKRRSVALDCDNAFAYDLQVTRESVVD